MRVESRLSRLRFTDSIIEAAVDEVSRNEQIPRTMITMSALAAVQAVVQAGYDVISPIGKRSALSLSILVVAESGERKTTGASHFLQPIRQFEAVQRQSNEAALVQWEMDMAVWEIEKRELRKALRQKISKGMCSEQAEEAWQIHLARRPERPRLIRLAYEDATEAALYRGLHDNYPAATLISTEAGEILMGPLLRNTFKLNSLWSGDPVVVDRVSRESFCLDDARLGMFLMVQPQVLERYQKQRGGLARSSGLLARFLVCYPLPAQGTRFLDGLTVSWQHIHRFHGRLQELLVDLQEAAKRGDRSRQEVRLSREAVNEWVDTYNWIEGEICQSGLYGEAGDHAAKLAENILRVAALIHVFEGYSGDVSEETLRYAKEICVRSSKSFLQLFVPPPQDASDADYLLSWIFDHFIGRNGHIIRKNDLLQFGPNHLRKDGRMNAALLFLHERKEVRLFRETKNGPMYVNLRPQLRQY